MSRFHATPPEAVSNLVREAVFVHGLTFTITRPENPDDLMDHPWVRSAYAADGYSPYWARLWPAARMLAKAVGTEPWPDPPPDVLEVGCGLGLAGIAALARGSRVTLSDVDTTALLFAERNARDNGYTQFRTLPLDFRDPPADVKYPLVIGSDLMYEERMVDALVDLLHAVLAPGGTCLITDPDRTAARVFRWKLAEAGFAVDAKMVRAGEPKGDRVKGTLYRITFEEATGRG